MSGPDGGVIDGVVAGSAPPSSPSGARVSSGMVTAAAIGVMTACTYVYLIITARILGPATYGGFAAAMNLLAILNVAALGLQATSARRIAAAPERKASLVSGISRITARASLVLTVVVLAATPLIWHGLGLESIWTALLVGACMFPMTWVGGQLGILQGERQWYRLAVVYVAGGLPRLLIGAALMWWRPSEFTALLAVFLGLWVPVAVAWWFGRRPRTEPEPREVDASVRPHTMRGLLWESAHNVQALLAFLVLSNIDILLARSVLDNHEAGLYAAGVMLARMMLVVSQTVSTVTFPDLASPDTRTRALGLGLGLVAVCGAAAALGTLLFPHLALALVGGPDYAEISDQLWRFVVLGTVAALVQFLIYALIALRVTQAIALTWISLAALVLVCAPARTVDGMVAAVTTVITGLAVVLLSMALVASPGTRAPSRPR